jgi:hypothetical protein
VTTPAPIHTITNTAANMDALCLLLDDQLNEMANNKHKINGPVGGYINSCVYACMYDMNNR